MAMSVVRLANEGPHFGSNYPDQPSTYGGEGGHVVLRGVAPVKKVHFVVYAYSVERESIAALYKCPEATTSRLFSALVTPFLLKEENKKDFELKVYRTNLGVDKLYVNKKHVQSYDNIARDILHAYNTGTQFVVKLKTSHFFSPNKFAEWHDKSESFPEQKAVTDVCEKIEQLQSGPIEGLIEDSDDEEEIAEKKSPSGVGGEEKAPPPREDDAKPSAIEEGEAKMMKLLSANPVSGDSFVEKLSRHIHSGQSPVVVVLLDKSKTSRDLEETLPRIRTIATHTHTFNGLPDRSSGVLEPLYNAIYHEKRRQNFPRTFVIHSFSSNVVVNELPGYPPWYFEALEGLC